MAKVGVIEEFVSPLLNHLKRVEREAKKYESTHPKIMDMFKEVQVQVEFAKNVLSEVKSWEGKLVDILGTIEKHLDYMLDSIDASHIYTELEAVQDKTTEMMKMIHPLLPSKQPKFEVGESSKPKISGDEDEADKKPISFDEEKIIKLNGDLALCFYSLFVFPKNNKLRKRLLINWWIGLELVQTGTTKTAKDVGEIFFNDLVNLGLLRPVERTNSKVVDGCIIEPKVHEQLIAAVKFIKDISGSTNGSNHYCASEIQINYKRKLGILVNLDQTYQKSHDITQMLLQINNMCAMQMGLCSMEPHHIEVDKTDFLKELKLSLTYLSLQGVSRITQLPDSIGNLVNLIVLDLRACHNLEKLPKKIEQMNKLMHLDVSMCYLLDHLPKWVGSLTNLEVMKGFIIGSSRNRDRCRLSDLAKLVKLEKLSMTIGGNSDVESAELQSLKDFTKLRSLTITCRVGKSEKNRKNIKESTKNINPPETLEKLDFRCYPKKKMPRWFKPTVLKNLKRLYIRGGELEKFLNDDGWIVEILRFRFLKNFEMSKSAVEVLFTKLAFVEWENCKKFDAVDGCWSKERDGPTLSDGDNSSNAGLSLNDGSEGTSDAPLLSGNSATKLAFVEQENCNKFDAVDGCWSKERDGPTLSDGGNSNNAGPSLNDGSEGTSDTPLLSGNSSSESGGDPLLSGSDPLQKGETSGGSSDRVSYIEDKKGETTVSFDVEKTIKLNPYLALCSYSLCVFPENLNLRKRLLINWWIGLELVQTGRMKTARDICEIIFNDLVNLRVLIPLEGTTIVDACIIEPKVHKQLIAAAKRRNFIHDISDSTYGSDHNRAVATRNTNESDHNPATVDRSTDGSDHNRTAAKGSTDGSDHYRVSSIRTNKEKLDMLLILNQRYTKSDDITKMLENKNLCAIQMGLYSVEPHHIEVDKTDFLKELKSSLTYLSLQGVSGITKLPDSIGNLVNLIVLDLRACHNLKKLPKKIKQMNKLMHFDVSMCHFLDHLPKWVGSLSNLEVLKGFVIGSSRNRDRCRLSGLAKLVKLRKLSMTIGGESDVASDELQSIKGLKKLHSLTITWRVGGCKDMTKRIEPPENLEKLDFRCYPEKEMPEWFKPTELKNLKRLYIRRGELEKFTNNVGWTVETLRLGFLNNFEMAKSAVEVLFIELAFVEWENCTKFDAVDGCWRKERDGPKLSGGGNSSNPGPSLNATA